MKLPRMHNGSPLPRDLIICAYQMRHPDSQSFRIAKYLEVTGRWHICCGDSRVPHHTSHVPVWHTLPFHGHLFHLWALF